MRGIRSDCVALCQSGMPAGQKMGPQFIGMPWGAIDCRGRIGSPR